jgi:chromosome segregation ATPase
MTSRDTYIKQLQHQLDEWDAEINLLSQDALRAKSELKADFEERIAGLRHQCEVAKEKIAEMQAARDTGWESLRGGADQMWGGIKQLVKETKDSFRAGCEEAKQDA